MESMRCCTAVVVVDVDPLAELSATRITFEGRGPALFTGFTFPVIGFADDEPEPVNCKLQRAWRGDEVKNVSQMW